MRFFVGREIALNDGILLSFSRCDRWPLNIRSAKADQLAQRIARLTGEDIETVLEDRLSRVALPVPANRKAAMDSFFQRLSRMSVLDPRPVDEVVGYDGCGLPS